MRRLARSASETVLTENPVDSAMSFNLALGVPIGSREIQNGPMTARRCQVSHFESKVVFHVRVGFPFCSLDLRRRRPIVRPVSSAKLPSAGDCVLTTVARWRRRKR